MFKLFAIQPEDIKTSEKSYVNTEELKYQAEKEKLEKTKKESARAYLLKKHQEEQDKAKQKGFGDKEYEKRMEFFRRIDKARQRDA